MSTETMIENLRGLYEKHKNDHVDTCATNWSLVCWDVANRLEELEKKNEELQSQIPKLHLATDVPNDKRDILLVEKEYEGKNLMYVGHYNHITQKYIWCDDSIEVVAWTELPKFEEVE